ncbi:multicopper oxidase family protein [Silvibacterium acidisoli]|uniref:multicopper oxidase family protein n=1 Tax=Acidobacteriaceae bacterium ZG23-2 TaxID=2883246 RepID=UPI00406CA267
MFTPSRRTFLQTSSLALAGFGTGRLAAMMPMHHMPATPQLDPSKLEPFVDALPIPALAKPSGTQPHPEKPGQTLPHYRIPQREAHVKVHRDLPPTRMWVYGDSFPGPTIEIQSGHGASVDWLNQLPAHHFLPIDHNLMGAEKSQPEVRTVTHLHGGRTPAKSDGYPEEWITPGQTQSCFYPSNQDASLFFYHDHTMGINRLNIYAGMQGFAIVRDEHEASLNLPNGQYEIPLLFADRLLAKDGQLIYPVSPDPANPWVPEVFGDSILVNGKLLPFHEVEPRLYRLRLFNGSNGRFYRISLEGKPALHVIGNDQGLLSAPVETKRIPLAPAERVDLLVDFSAFAGKNIKLVSDSFDLMQFRVGTKTSTPSPAIPKALREQPLPPPSQLDEKTALRTRRLTLDENLDQIQNSTGMLLNKTPWHAPITEKPVLNTTEIWELVNLTEDSHPIHLHLVRFRILDRRPLDTYGFQMTGNVRFTGPAIPPEPLESGWKDTARTDPGTITRILVPFEGYAGKYVWHCHILEHEDNEMMRPYEVLPEGSKG